MASKEEAIAELSKLLASGALSPEAFAQAIKALSDNDTSDSSEEIQRPSELSRDQKIYYTVMEYIRNNLMKSPSTVKYPPFSECEIVTLDDSSDLSDLDIITTNQEDGIRYQYCPYPLDLLMERTTRKPLITRWRTYIDAQNTYGAIVRNKCDFSFDDNNNLICARIKSDDEFHYLPLSIVKDFQIIEDSIESELYEQYMSTFTSSGIFNKWTYPPYNQRMLNDDKELFYSGFFDLDGYMAKVTRIETWISSPEPHSEQLPIEIILDGKDSFNLIRIVYGYKDIKYEKTDITKK